MTARLNKACAYYPCHDELGDCTFCYCPFYPCLDVRLGHYITIRAGRRIWSCQDCNWIHKKKVVDKIFLVIKKANIKVNRIAGKAKGEKRGVIILGHGSKLASANDAISKVAKDIRKRIGLDIVEPAYLTLCKPDIKEAVRKVARGGCRTIIVVPFFLSMGNHVTRDVPKAIRAEAMIHKDIKFIYAKNIGQDSRISDIAIDCVREALR